MTVNSIRAPVWKKKKKIIVQSWQWSSCKERAGWLYTRYTLVSLFQYLCRLSHQPHSKAELADTATHWSHDVAMMQSRGKSNKIALTLHIQYYIMYTYKWHILNLEIFATCTVYMYFRSLWLLQKLTAIINYKSATILPKAIWDPKIKFNSANTYMYTCNNISGYTAYMYVLLII